MVALLRYTKFFVKLIAILIFLFVLHTYQNNSFKRRRIRHFQIWKNIFGRRLPVKYILIWLEEDPDLHILKKRHEAFIENKCVHKNCYVTTNRFMIDKDYRNFDAIVMSAKLIHNTSIPVPEKRFSNQTFVFASSESAEYYPVCNETFNEYFNLTWTYKLNSDVPWLYFNVYDKKSKKVAPKTDVKWMTHMEPVPEIDMKKITSLKKFAVAWFASNCHTNSNRESFVHHLNLALKKYGLEVDIVGKCGTKVCPIEMEKECLKILEQFFFYLAFENSLTEDYVTEKVLRPMLHDVVPVVFGGANYSRFLPPKSYINALKFGPLKTAAVMASLILNHTAYLEYFKWRNYYSVRATTNSVCDLCRLINTIETKIYSDFRKWWNPEYNQTCNTISRHMFFNGP